VVTVASKFPLGDFMLSRKKDHSGKVPADQKKWSELWQSNKQWPRVGWSTDQPTE